VNPLITDNFMTIALASILNLVGPDMMMVLLIVLLLFGAKKLPELARGMGKAVKEFSAARDEIEKGLSQSGPTSAQLGDSHSKASPDNPARS
jgi:sec-independent protein translocase protein TatA